MVKWWSRRDLGGSVQTLPLSGAGIKEWLTFSCHVCCLESLLFLLLPLPSVFHTAHIPESHIVHLHIFPTI